MIEIWQPRWHDRVVLIACHKVKDGDNLISFSKVKGLEEKEFHMDGDKIRSYPLDDNGKIQCYAVPYDILTGEKNA